MNNEFYFGQKLSISDGSASGTVNWSDGGKCGGTYVGSVTWTPPPSFMLPGSKINFSMTAKTTVNNTCGSRSIDSFGWIKAEGVTIVKALEERSPSAGGTYTVPTGSPGQKMQMWATVKVANLNGTVTYNYVFKGAASATRPPAPPKAPARPKENKKEATVTISGLVFDGAGRPMPYLSMTASSMSAKDVPVPVDENGRYSVTVKLPVPTPESAKKVTLTVMLTYRRSGRVWFALVRHPAPKDFPTEIRAGFDVFVDPATPTKKEDLAFRASKGIKANLKDLTHLEQASAIYTNYYDALTFAERLPVDLSGNVPVTIQFGSARPTVYNYETNTVLLEDKYAIIGDRTGRHAQWHEYGHYVHYVGRGHGWYTAAAPADGSSANRAHGGYANPDTADSIMEGAAHFFGALVAKHTVVPEPNPAAIGTFSDLSQPIVPWGHEGRDEEFAFAAVMWDLAEKRILEPRSVWSLLCDTTVQTFTVFYERARALAGTKGGDVDGVFKTHGIYALSRKGNGTYDPEEAFIDLNGDGRKGADEPFIDYSVDDAGQIAMSASEKDKIVLGQSANYQRVGLGAQKSGMQERYSTFRFPNAYLKTTGGSADALKIRIVYRSAPPYEVVAAVEGGRIAVPLLATSVDADFLVLPADSSNDAGALYRTTTGEIEKKFRNSRGTDHLDTVTLPATMVAAGSPPRPADPLDGGGAGTPGGSAQTGDTAGAGGPGDGGGGAPVVDVGGSRGAALMLTAYGAVALLAVAAVLILRRRRAGARPAEPKIAARLTSVNARGRASEHLIQASKTSLGSSADNTIVLDDDAVSSHHAEIVVSGRTFVIRDVGSSNGTFVNGHSVTECTLYQGDTIVVGTSTLTFDA